MARTLFSGRKIQPPKNPLVNLARISSSESSPISFFERKIERVSCTAWWFLGLMILRDGEAAQDLESELVDMIVRDLDAERGWLYR